MLRSKPGTDLDKDCEGLRESQIEYETQDPVMRVPERSLYESSAVRQVRPSETVNEWTCAVRMMMTAGTRPQMIASNQTFHVSIVNPQARTTWILTGILSGSACGWASEVSVIENTRR